MQDTVRQWRWCSNACFVPLSFDGVWRWIQSPGETQTYDFKWGGMFRLFIIHEDVVFRDQRGGINPGGGALRRWPVRLQPRHDTSSCQSSPPGRLHLSPSLPCCCSVIVWGTVSVLSIVNSSRTVGFYQHHLRFWKQKLLRCLSAVLQDHTDHLDSFALWCHGQDLSLALRH